MSTTPEHDKKPVTIRRLGNNEAYQLAMYMLDQYRGTSVCCRYEIPLGLTGTESHSKLKNTVNDAIIRTIMKHPALQVGILGAQTKKAVWIQLGGLDMQHHIEWRYIDQSPDIHQEIQGIIEAQLDTQFYELDKRPGWRVVPILNGEEPSILSVIFTWNHPHADGISGKLFHIDLLDMLNTERPLDSHCILNGGVLELPRPLPEFIPSTEQLVKLPVSANFLMKALWEDSKPSIFRKRPEQADWAPICTSPYKTRLCAFTISAETCSNITAACRAHKTTITGLLHALALLSLSLRIKERDAVAFESATPINLRRHLPAQHPKCPWLVPEHTISNFVSLMSHKFNTSLTEQVRSHFQSTHASENLSPGLLDLMWTVSSTVRGEIEQRLKRGLKNDAVGLMKYVPNWQEQLSNLARKPRQYSWLVTNLGVLNGKPNLEKTSHKTQGDAWTIKGAQFSLSAETTSAAIMISPVTVVNEQLCVAGSWQECIMEEDQGEQIMGDLQRWLTQIGSKAH
ncbi:alcohol acetyltransferase-domain-containing protein [Xylaria cf. heliscus]|nr:alcohol acetyltransferase-domain-containing protein [Xylaria cf. heliscus]